MQMEHIDQNLSAEKGKNNGEFLFYNAAEPPFTVLGAFEYGKDVFARRMPQSAAVTPKLSWLNTCNSGVRVCFKTNSPLLAVKADYVGFGRTTHDTLAGSAGINIMVSENGGPLKFADLIEPSFNELFDEINGKPAAFRRTVNLKSAAERTVVLFLPVESAVRRLTLGIVPGSSLKPANPYRYQKPVVFYGSSITMGCCASRPGNTYPAMISQLLSTDFLNLGFAGNALGELEIAQHIATLPASAFVLDYDHNAPTTEHLAKTHEPFFKAVRRLQPKLPIILLSRPIPHGAEDQDRLKIITTTYLNALNSGDRNVYFINGGNLFNGWNRELCAIDWHHPNDLGYFKMAECLAGILKPFLA